MRYRHNLTDVQASFSVQSNARDLALVELEAANANLVSTISLKRNTPTLQLSTTWPARLSHLTEVDLPCRRSEWHQLGCGVTNALIIDDRSGIITKTELTEGGADEVWYDAGSNHGSWSCENVLAEAGAATSAPPSGEPCSRFRPPEVG